MAAGKIGASNNRRNLINIRFIDWKFCFPSDLILSLPLLLPPPNYGKSFYFLSYKILFKFFFPLPDNNFFKNGHFHLNLCSHRFFVLNYFFPFIISSSQDSHLEIKPAEDSRDRLPLILLYYSAEYFISFIYLLANYFLWIE